ncbi:LysR family transcriptional regulator [Eggerthella lenta]|uniref:LysR family transcriptional regulator n=1 Tax=Eggerthella lenta TaxID=84112 RepID=UPI000DF68ACE|nr:LysR family transcriptional regulator [Eggerthella lenta]RDB72665.1 LysR family transcriptional regulator [Eggerthella lenta]
METAYLHEFAKVAECGSFTAAARELHLTQSTLSKHVALLEREFGAGLFVRDRSGVSLTEAGGVLYAQARQMEKLLRATELLVRAARDGQAAGSTGSTAGVAAGGTVDGSPAAAGDTALRCKCRLAAERCGLDRRELGALILYVEEHGFEAIQGELALTRDEVADVLGSVYRKLGVGDKQEALDFIHSVSE